MLDFVIGPILRIIDNNSFQIQVTHIGKENKYPYKNFENVVIAPNPTVPNPTLLSPALIGRRVRCKVRYRDNYDRLYSDVELES